MRRPLRVQALAAVAVTATLAACGSSQGGAPAASSSAGSSPVPAPSTVTVALGGGFLSIHAPFLAAMQTGALHAVEQKYGLTVNVQAFGGGNDAMQAVLGGSADFALVSASLLAGADFKGQDLVAVFDQNHGNSTVVIGAKKDESKGTSIKNYDGANWGYIKEGAPSQLILQDLATRAGLNWKNQQGVAIGSVDATIPSLQSNRIDIVAIGSTVAGKAIQLGLAYPILNGNDTDAARKVWGVQIAAPLVTTHGFARKYPQVTQAIVEAMLKGLMAIKDKASDTTAAYGLMPSQFTQSVTQDDFKLSWPLDAPAFKGTDGVFHKDAVDSTIKLLVQQGVLPTKDAVSTDILFDNQYVLGAYRDLGKTPPTP